MMSLQDLIYNWLTIKVVVDARPEDTAAIDTKNMFEELLEKDHGIQDPEVKINDEMYAVTINKSGAPKTYHFPSDLIEVMLDQINIEPEKYMNYPDE